MNTFTRLSIINKKDIEYIREGLPKNRKVTLSEDALKNETFCPEISDISAESVQERSGIRNAWWSSFLQFPTMVK
jgi:hypothetical protein